jgi:hypothetical protein
MILSIPHQTFEVSNIHLSPFQLDKYSRAIARLNYKDSSVDFQDVTILSPPVRVIDFNFDCNRLRVDLSEQRHFQTKLQTIQDYLVRTFYIHQMSFLNKMYHSEQEIRSLFNFLLDNNTLCLYIYPTTSVKLADGSSIKVSELKSGDYVRFVIRIQGISQIWRPTTGLHLRFQHTVPSMWFLS